MRPKHRSSAGFSMMELPAMSRVFSHRRGFTLVELLVVMGIATVVMSLFLVAATKVRESVKRVVCSNNLRQIGVGFLGYAASNSSRVLPPVVYNNNWGVSGFDTLYRTTNPSPLGCILPYLGTGNGANMVLTCPMGYKTIGYGTTNL